MCDTVVSNDPPLMVYCPDKYITQKMCDKAVDENPFLIVYCPDKYITQKMCDEGVDYSLEVLELIPDWFATSKMVKIFFTVLYVDKNILYFDEDSGEAVFNSNEIWVFLI